MSSCYCPSCDSIQNINFKKSVFHGTANFVANATGEAIKKGASFGAAKLSEVDKSELMRQGYSEAQAEEILTEKYHSDMGKRGLDELENEAHDKSFRPHCAHCDQVLTYISAQNATEYGHIKRAVTKASAKLYGGFFAFSMIAVVLMMAGPFLPRSIAGAYIGFTFIAAGLGAFLGPQYIEKLSWKTQDKIISFLGGTGYFILGTIASGILGMMAAGAVSDNKTKNIVSLSVFALGFVGSLGFTYLQGKKDMGYLDKLREKSSENDLITINGYRSKATAIILCFMWPGSQRIYLRNYLNGFLCSAIIFPIGIIASVKDLVVLLKMSEFEFNSTVNPGLLEEVDYSPSEQAQVA